MGKKIIIKGANFSNVAVDTSGYIFDLSDSTLQSLYDEGSTLSSAGTIIWDSQNCGNYTKFLSHSLTGIKICTGGSTGVLTFYLVNGSNFDDYTEVATISITGSGLREYSFSSPITIPQGYALGMKHTSIIQLKYMEHGQSELSVGFTWKNGTTILNLVNSAIPIDFKFEDIADM